MSTDNSTPMIYSKIAAIIADLGAIEKNKNNKEQGFKYRGIDDVYNAIHPLFAKHGVFTAPEILERVQNEHLTKSGAAWKHVIIKVCYTYYAADGSSVKSVIYGEGLDNGDKATNKALAVAHKYSLLQMFCVATDDMDDPDERTAPEAITKQAPRQAPAGNGHDAAAPTAAPAENTHAAAKPETYEEKCARGLKWLVAHKAQHGYVDLLSFYNVAECGDIPANLRDKFLVQLKAIMEAVRQDRQKADAGNGFNKAPQSVNSQPAEPPAYDPQLGF